MIKYRGVTVFYLGLKRWRFIFGPECRMDYICRNGIRQVQRVIDYHLEAYGGVIWG